MFIVTLLTILILVANDVPDGQPSDSVNIDLQRQVVASRGPFLTPWRPHSWQWMFVRRSLIGLPTD